MTQRLGIFGCIILYTAIVVYITLAFGQNHWLETTGPLLRSQGAYQMAEWIRKDLLNRHNFKYDTKFEWRKK